MKHIFIIALFTVAFLQGCEDFLAEEALTDISSYSVYNTKQGIISGSVLLYDLYRDYYTSVTGDNIVCTPLYKCTDISVSRVANTGGEYYDPLLLTPELYKVGEWKWNRFYRIIDRANGLIEGGQKLDQDDELVAALGEAAFFRAFMYYNLISLFDNVYLTLSPTNSRDVLNNDIEYLPADEEDVFNQIFEDLDYAIKYLPLRADAGRLTSSAARLLKARAAMWSGDFDEAAAQADTIIESGVYDLVDRSQVFKAMDINHSETMFAVQFKIDVAGGGNHHRLPLVFTTRYNKVCDPINELGGYGWGRTYPNPYLRSLYGDTDGDGIVDLDTDGDNIPDNNDVRFTEYYNHFFYQDNDDGTRDTLKFDHTSYEYLERAYPSSTKYLDPDKEPGVKKSYRDIIVFRYSEVYLLGAEAHLKASLRDETKALAYINIIRSKAGMNELSSIAEGIAENTVYNDNKIANEDPEDTFILRERAKELGLEGQRWFTLKRMGSLVERVRAYAGDIAFPDQSVARTNIQDYHVRRPIPQSFINNTNGSFPQNAGYSAN